MNKKLNEIVKYLSIDLNVNNIAYFQIEISHLISFESINLDRLQQNALNIKHKQSSGIRW